MVRQSLELPTWSMALRRSLSPVCWQGPMRLPWRTRVMEAQLHRILQLCRSRFLTLIGCPQSCSCCCSDRSDTFRHVAAHNVCVVLRKIEESMRKELSVPWLGSLQTVRVLAAAMLLLCTMGVHSVWAQEQGYSAVALQPPDVDLIDRNFVSMLTGKVQFTIPALKMGDVSFTAY